MLRIIQASRQLRIGRSETESRSLFFSKRFSAATNAEHLNSVNVVGDEISISEACVRRLKAIATDDNFLRVAVESGGCSGFQYKFELDTVINEDDKIFDKDGVKVVVDTVSLDFLKGSTVDFKEELIRSAFRIDNNPVAEKGCSCGVSFTVK